MSCGQKFTQFINTINLKTFNKRKIQGKGLLQLAILKENDFELIMSSVADMYTDNKEMVIAAVGLENVLISMRYYLNKKYNFYGRTSNESSVNTGRNRRYIPIGKRA